MNINDPTKDPAFQEWIAEIKRDGVRPIEPVKQPPLVAAGDPSKDPAFEQWIADMKAMSRDELESLSHVAKEHGDEYWDIAEKREAVS
jgi:hypothetical protein